MQFIVYEECYFNISIITFYIKDTILHMRIIYDVTFFLLIYLKTPLVRKARTFTVLSVIFW